LEAARATLNHRGDGGTGWSKANKINLWARLLDGNRAHRLLAEQLKSSTLENLWDTHAPFQIDGNFGATSGMAEMLLQSHTGYIAPLPALPDAWKDGQVSGLVARGNFEVSMKWKEKNLESLAFLSHAGGDLVVDYPDIESSIVKINGKEIKPTLLKENRIQIATQKGDLITFEKLPEQVTRLSAVRKDAVTAELDFNPVTDATHYVIRRESKDESNDASSVKEFLTNVTHFIDRFIDSLHSYSYTVRAMIGERSRQASEVASIQPVVEWMDDRDPRVQYGPAFHNWEDADLFAGTEKYADLTVDSYSDNDATARISFNGRGIEIYGLKSSELGLAEVQIDGKKVGDLDFHTSGETEKSALIGRFTGLPDGEHLLTLTVKKEHLNRGNERSKISIDYFKIYPGQGATVEKMDDRDSRIHYGSLFKDWNESDLYQTTEKYATLQNMDPSQYSEAKATIPFTGTGIRIYGLKSSDYGKALVTIDGKEMPSLDFYSSADYEKNVLIGEYTNLSNGDHILTLTVDPNSPDDRKMISLDSFDILKPSTVSLDTPSLAPIKAGDQTITFTLPSGEWDAIALHFPGEKDPIFLKKTEEQHVALSDGNRVLAIKDQQVELPIPETAHQKQTQIISAYAIRGKTITSPVVSLLPAIVTSLGDQKPPVVTLPEYTEPIGTSGQEAPILSLPEYVLRVLKDQASKVEVISGENEIGSDSHLEIQKVLDQGLFGKTYDAFNLQLKDKEGNPVPVKGSVLVRLPLSKEVKQLYVLTPNQELQAVEFTLREGMIEFMTQELGTYAIVYKTKSETIPFISSPHEKVEPTVSERREPNKPVSESTSPKKAGDSLMSVPNSKQDQASQIQLPKTNTGHSSYLLFLAGLSLVLAASFLEKKKND
jgi:possible alpha-L-fucosidase